MKLVIFLGYLLFIVKSIECSSKNDVEEELGNIDVNLTLKSYLRINSSDMKLYTLYDEVSMLKTYHIKPII